MSRARLLNLFQSPSETRENNEANFPDNSARTRYALKMSFFVHTFYIIHFMEKGSESYLNNNDASTMKIVTLKATWVT